MKNFIKTLIIRFAVNIAHHEIPLFRGAINSLLESSSDTLLFHNHTEEGLRYAYPLIQYKRIGGKAAIVCVGEGTEVIGEFFSSIRPEITIGDRVEILKIESVIPSRMLLQVWKGEFEYHLRKWLPLNKGNYDKFVKLEGVVEKTRMLESILIGNILSMAKTLDVIFDKEVSVKITSVDSPHAIKYKGVKLMSFDVEFKSNVCLPYFIGVGKGVSVGFGMVTNKHLRKENSNNEN